MGDYLRRCINVMSSCVDCTSGLTQARFQVCFLWPKSRKTLIQTCHFTERKGDTWIWRYRAQLGLSCSLDRHPIGAYSHSSNSVSTISHWHRCTATGAWHCQHCLLTPQYSNVAFKEAFRLNWCIKMGRKDYRPLRFNRAGGLHALRRRLHHGKKYHSVLQPARNINVEPEPTPPMPMPAPVGPVPEPAPEPQLQSEPVVAEVP